MKSKKKRSQKRRRGRKKAGKQGLPNLLPQISQEQGKRLAATMTGEFFQPIRVHYDRMESIERRKGFPLIPESRKRNHERKSAIPLG